jgi:plastocyanin
MRRLLLPIVAAFVLVLGLGAFAVAQDASPPAEEENLCPEAIGTPDASPDSMAMDEGMATPPAMDEGSPSASPGAEEECHVDIEDFAFSPATIEIEAGTTVTWENYDSAPHTVTADDGSFDSGDLAQDQTFSHTFDQPGTYSYSCTIHPNMTGTVIVR